MKLLLDACIVIWILADSPDLKRKSKEAIQKAETCYVSSISVSEIEIKRSIGKLDIPSGYVVKIIESGLDSLSFRFKEAEILGTLPYHHKDPFDRMLISQAIANDLTILTDDSIFKQYNVPVLLNRN